MTTTPRLPQSMRLSHSGQVAELTRDDLTPCGVVLSTGTPETGMAEQSHVEAGDPDFLLHDYLRRMRSVLTASAAGLFQDGEPTPVHLGAGALTLPRWMEQRWPGTAQTVVDIEPELVDFVLEHLPMETPPETIVADAATVLGPDGELADRRFDVVVVDLFNSAEAPASLTSPAFFREVLGTLQEPGVLLMNIGDDADMRFARRLTGTLLAAVEEAGGGPKHALLTAPDGVLGAREEGNLVFAARLDRAFSEEERNQIWAAGPHPGDVLSGEELIRWSRP